MPARYPCPLDGVARKWVALAERRTAHIVELYDTGRWRHYYTQAELVAALREAIRVRDQWARIAGRRRSSGCGGKAGAAHERAIISPGHAAA